MPFMYVKDKTKDIEEAFTRLKASESNLNACEKIGDALSSITNKTIRVSTVSPTVKNAQCTIMSVYPDESVLDKIIVAVVNNQSDSIVNKIWEECTVWNIEIDTRILGKDLDFSEEELTAMLLHEVGHVIDSNSVPNRINTIVKFYIAKSGVVNKEILKDTFFNKVLYVPIMNACAFNRHRAALKSEMRADAYAVKAGYGKALNSAMDKIVKYAATDVSPEKEMQDLMAFSMDTIETFKKRQHAVVFKDYMTLSKSTNSPYMKGVLASFMNTIKKPGQISNSLVRESYNDTFLNGRMDKIIQETYDSDLFVEGFFNRIKKMKRIDPMTLDYIAIEVDNIKTNDDKMMIISLIYSTLDTVNYYLELLRYGDKSYQIPHSKSELESIKNRLEACRADAISKQLPKVEYGLNIQWPDGYEG